jgi:hypothetical protein
VKSHGCRVAPGGLLACAEGWQETLLERAVPQVWRRANPKHAQILDLCLLRGQSGAEVARVLDVSRMTVYLVKTRLGRELKRALDRLRQSGSL